MSEQLAALSPQLLLPCPECHQSSDRLKCYNLGTFVFLGIAAVWQKRPTTACPKCMKPKLLKCAGINLFTLHVLWPFIMLPATVYRWLDLSTPGHSQSILERMATGAFGPEIARIAAEILRQPKPVNPAHTRAFGIVKIVLSVWAIGICLVVMTNSWYSGNLSRKDLDVYLVLTTIIAGLAAGTLWSGIRSVRLRSRTWLSWGVAVIAGGSLYFGMCPVVRDAYWQMRERRAAAHLADDPLEYEYLPEEVMQPGPVRELMQRSIQNRSLSQLEYMMDRIERAHPENTEFQKIVAEYRNLK